jgi:putative transposase
MCKEWDMKRAKYTRVKVRLTRKDRLRVRVIQEKGIESARVIRRARMLELLHEGVGVIEISRRLKVRDATVRQTGWRYCEEGLEGALRERPRPGQPRRLNDQQASAIIAMTCSTPPAGYARWTIRLIAEEAVKRGYVGRIAKDAIHRFLRSRQMKPWREKNVVRAGTGRRVHSPDGGRSKTIRKAAQ